MPTTITEEVPIEAHIYRSTADGCIVVQIDTWSGLEDLRVNLNDGLIWHGDPESTTGYRDLLAAIDTEQKRTLKQPPELVAQSDADFRAFVASLLRNTGEFV
jgi:hypothetical protein